MPYLIHPYSIVYVGLSTLAHFLWFIQQFITYQYGNSIVSIKRGIYFQCAIQEWSSCVTFCGEKQVESIQCMCFGNPNTWSRYQQSYTLRQCAIYWQIHEQPNFCKVKGKVNQIIIALVKKYYLIITSLKRRRRQRPQKDEAICRQQVCQKS